MIVIMRFLRERGARSDRPREKVICLNYDSMMRGKSTKLKQIIEPDRDCDVVII